MNLLLGYINQKSKSHDIQQQMIKFIQSDYYKNNAIKLILKHDSNELNYRVIDLISQCILHIQVQPCFTKTQCFEIDIYCITENKKMFLNFNIRKTIRGNGRAMAIIFIFSLSRIDMLQAYI